MALIRARPGWALCLGWLVFVVYGSLLPFDLHPLPMAQALARWQAIPFLQLGVDSRADWVANGVLYLPVGLLLAQCLRAAWGDHLLARWGAGLSALALGCGLALAVEFSQLFFPSRTVSQNDLMAECLGTLVGVVLAPWVGRWADALQRAWAQDGQRLLPRLLEGYAAAYLLLSLFPFDLLLSAAEWQAKLASGTCGWWLAPVSLQRGWLLGVLLAVEVALSVPVGIWLAWRPVPRLTGPGSRPGRVQPPQRARLAPALLAGAGLGLLIEGGQLAIASGISQGFSVLTRAVGVALGAQLGSVLLAHLSGQRNAAPWAAAWRRLKPWLVLPYLGLLAGVNGWWTQAWGGPDTWQAQWAAVHLMPFWYHYYTSEAEAVFSLGSVALMYLPVAALLGHLRAPVAGVVVAAGGLAAVIETGKLGLSGLHPDPTNVVIAMATCWLAMRLAGWALSPVRAADVDAIANSAGRGSAPAAPGPLQAGSSPAATTQAAGAGLARMCTAALLALAAVSALALPWGAASVAAGVAAAAALVWWRPVLALALLPAALPVLDLAPWTGRFFWDEFDILLLAVLAVGWHRSRPVGRGLARPAGRSGAPAGFAALQALALGLLGLSLTLSALRGLLPWQWPDLNSFSSYYSGWNALRIFKGALWAGAWVALFKRLPQASAAKQAVFGCGMLTGLALTVLQVGWERLAFPGLLDFASDYRITGPISAMHTGGAYIECWLAIGSAFGLWAVLRPGQAAWRTAAGALVLACTYALAVTYSRNGYGAGLVVAGVMAGMAARLAAGLTAVNAAQAGLHAATLPPGRKPGRVLLPLAGVLVLMAAVALPVLTGPYARTRLADLARDHAVRLAHWQDAVTLRQPGGLNLLLGAGLGSYPAAHYWRSAEPVHAGSYALADEPGRRFLRLGTGAPVYIEQVVPVQAGQRLQLALAVRGPASAVLGVMLCEKWLLTSVACATVAVQADKPAAATAAVAAAAAAGNADPAANTAWRTVTLVLSTEAWPRTQAWVGRPVKLAVFHGAGDGTVDVSRLVLTAQTADAKPAISTAQSDSRTPSLLRNGDFSAGLDHWFFSTDVDPPWHVHSTPVAVWFEQGWLGVLAWSLAGGLAVCAAARRAWRGDLNGAAVLAALLAAGVCGAVNTLTDAPRFLTLLLVLMWLAGERGSTLPGRAPGMSNSASNGLSQAPAAPASATLDHAFNRSPSPYP